MEFYNLDSYFWYLSPIFLVNCFFLANSHLFFEIKFLIGFYYPMHFPGWDLSFDFSFFLDFLPIYIFYDNSYITCYFLRILQALSWTYSGRLGFLVAVWCLKWSTQAKFEGCLCKTKWIKILTKIKDNCLIGLNEL